MTSAEASRYARRRWPRSVGFQSAYLDGFRAGRDGRPPDVCPYRRRTRARRARGWRLVWRSVWLEGWASGSDAATVSRLT